MCLRDHIRQRISIEDRGHSTPCWIWQSGINNAGYATGRPSGWRHGVMHRMAYEEYTGPIPSGCVVDHLCSVRACVNPDHLDAVTQRENIHRAMARNPGFGKKGKRDAQPKTRVGGSQVGRASLNAQTDDTAHRNGSVTP